MNADALKEYGVDYCAGVRRFLDDSELYEEMLGEFLSDGSFMRLEQAVEAGEYLAAFEQAHALKGVSGNLDMTALYRTSSVLTEYLRYNDAPDAEKLRELFESTKTAYERVVEGIRSEMD